MCTCDKIVFASVPASLQQATPLDKPYFPISMRLLRVVSILIQKYHFLLVNILKFLHCL